MIIISLTKNELKDLLNTEKQNDESWLKDGLFWIIGRAEMGIVNFYYFYHHF